MEPNKELVEKAKSGDEEAFSLLFEQYKDRIYSLCLRMTGNREDAGDMCQETFIKAFKSIEKFRSHSSFSTWIYRIAINHTKDFIRSKARKRGSPVHALSESRLLIDEANISPQEHALKTERVKIVQQALLELPENMRTPLILFEIENLEYREISRILRLPVGTVKSRIFRAKIALGEILEPLREHLE
ncbi:MAG: sigma-70 family RNA polymerase sigma factor [Actinomycetota bacterium]|nr:sigma-70 family RNA polymerase sigma factor [Actinomycetota bacterium]